MKAKLVLVAVSAAIASLAVSVPVVARPGSGATTAAEKTRVKVRVHDNFFDPRSLGVAQGGKVTFVWKGTNRHNVRFTKVPPGASRKSSKVKRHGRWSRRFAKPGLYRYVCTLFAGMRGTVTVKPPTSGEG